MEGLKLNFNPQKPKWANKILKRHGQSEMASITNLKDEGKDYELEENLRNSQFEVNLLLKN